MKIRLNKTWKDTYLKTSSYEIESLSTKYPPYNMVPEQAKNGIAWANPKARPENMHFTVIEGYGKKKKKVGCEFSTS